MKSIKITYDFDVNRMTFVSKMCEISAKKNKLGSGFCLGPVPLCLSNEIYALADRVVRVLLLSTNTR